MPLRLRTLWLLWPELVDRWALYRRQANDFTATGDMDTGVAAGLLRIAATDAAGDMGMAAVMATDKAYSL